MIYLHQKKSYQGGIKIIRQIGSGPAIFRILLKGCRFFICLHCKHIKKHYCLVLRGNRTAGFIRPAVSSVRAISIRRFCIPYLRPHAGRGVRSTPVLVLSPVKIANAIFTAPRGGVRCTPVLVSSPEKSSKKIFLPPKGGGLP